MKYVLILLLAFHLGACSPRILVYDGTSQDQIDEFNQAGPRSGLKQDPTNFRVRIIKDAKEKIE